MRARALDPETLPDVPARLAYAAPMADKPYNDTYGPPPGMPRSNAIPDEREVQIHSLRPIAAALSLDGQSFAVVPNRSADAATTGAARVVAHSAVADPTKPPDALPRESIEIGTIAFFA